MKYKISFNSIASDKNYILEDLAITLEEFSSGRKTVFIASKKYLDTNEFINFLSENPAFKSFVSNNYSYKDVCHWQFFPSYIWPYWYFYVECFKILRDFVNTHSVSALEVKKSENFYSKIFNNLLDTLCFQNKITLTLISEAKYCPKLAIKIRSFLGNTYRKICFYLLIFQLNQSSRKPKKYNNTVLLFSSSVNLELQDFFYKDRQMLKIETALSEKGFNPICVYANTFNFEDLKNKFISQKIKCESYIFYCNMKTYFLHNFMRVKKRSRLEEDITWNGINLNSILNHFFEFVEKEIYPSTIFYRKACRDLLTKYSPQAVFLTYETGPIQRAVIIEADRLGIRTIGLQHGMIFSNHYDYMHSRIVNKSAEMGFLIPDVMAVWGDYWKDILTKQGNYTFESVQVVGDWRKEARPRKQKINEHSFKILLMTNTLKSNDFISNARLAIEKSSIFEIFYRPHPGEINEIKNYDLRNIKVTAGSLDEEISKVNIVISAASTSIIDALVMQKPVIFFNHNKVEGWCEFKKMKGCFYVDDKDQLLDKLINLIYLDKDIYQKMLDEIAEQNTLFCKYFGKTSLDNLIQLIN